MQPTLSPLTCFNDARPTSSLSTNFRLIVTKDITPQPLPSSRPHVSLPYGPPLLPVTQEAFSGDMNPSGPNAQTRMKDEQDTIVFEHFTAETYYNGSSGAGRARSIHCTSFPSSPEGRSHYQRLDAALVEEDGWNLIPYDVPWGSEYYHYHAGTLPGPDGACIFLRSPTPLKERRVHTACNRCRKRKIKCSGSRPQCTRCIVRGYTCEYVEENKPTARKNTRPGRRQRAHSKFSAETNVSFSDCDYVQPKESPGLYYTPELSFTDTDTRCPSDDNTRDDEVRCLLEARYKSEHEAAAEETYEEQAAIGEHWKHSPYAEGYSSPPVGPVSSQVDYKATKSHTAATVGHADPFLIPEEQMAAFSAATLMPGSDADICAHEHGQELQPPMLFGLAAADEVAAPISLLQVPFMWSLTDPMLEPACAVEYVQPQNMFHYLMACSEPTMQFTDLK